MYTVLTKALLVGNGENQSVRLDHTEANVSSEMTNSSDGLCSILCGRFMKMKKARSLSNFDRLLVVLGVMRGRLCWKAACFKTQEW